MELIEEGYTRVSEILSVFQGYSSIPRGQLKKAQDSGTFIHKCIENHFNHEFDLIPLPYQGFMTSFHLWEKEWKPQKILMEKRFYCPHLMITGKADLIAHFGDKDKSAYIIDFKTGSIPHPKIWEMQLTFYRYLITQSEDDHLVANNMMIIHLKKDGSAPDIYAFVYDEKVWEVCLHAMSCWKFLVKNPEVIYHS